jgi:hypothetical protein
MRTLTSNDAIRIWEKGHHQQPGQRVLSLLSAACPEQNSVELRRLTIGQCDDRLREARKRVLGSEVNGFSECAACGEYLEFILDTDHFRAPSPSSETASEFVLDSDGYTIRFRLLNLEDLDIAASSKAVDAVRGQLVERCVLEASYGKERVPAAELPENITAELGRRLAELDSGSDISIELTCPACGIRHQLSFDISSFFYTEISVQAQRRLREVHILASAYGWRESEILELSARRRQFYLEMLER